MKLGVDMDKNGDRQDYVRSRAERQGDEWIATPLEIQDSSMLSALAASDVLIVRPPEAPAAKAGDICPVIRLRDL